LVLAQNHLLFSSSSPPSLVPHYFSLYKSTIDKQKLYIIKTCNVMIWYIYIYIYSVIINTTKSINMSIITQFLFVWLSVGVEYIYVEKWSHCIKLAHNAKLHYSMLLVSAIYQEESRIIKQIHLRCKWKIFFDLSRIIILKRYA
jgi:hypothetical protein